MEVPWGSDGLELRALEHGYRVFVGGEPRYASATMTLDHDAAEADMDPRDLGIGCEEPELKAARSYLPIPTSRSAGAARASPRSWSSS